MDKDMDKDKDKDKDKDMLQIGLMMTLAQNSICICKSGQR